jgi:hypothetical protein
VSHLARGNGDVDDKKLLALAKKNAAKALKPLPPARKYDATLPVEPPQEDSEDLRKFFKEMKRREF